MIVDYEWIEGGKCIICGQAFEELHLASKKTCGNTCRQKLHRYGERVENVYWQMVDAVKFYETTIEIDELRDETIKKLGKIKSRIDSLLNSAV
jgi:predicted nucleic acid-binding Zn ribbon protein